MEIIIPVALAFGVALVCAIILTVSDHFFGVKEDETFVAVRDCLPGANCGACGYSGCDGYAKALSDGSVTSTNLCIPGGEKTATEIANLLGVAAEEVVEKVAYVACNGSAGPDERKYEYRGMPSCAAANLFFAGDRHCVYACLGYGDSVRVCPRDAITINEERCIAEINPKKCIGCGLCVKTCPNGIINLIDDVSTVVVKCKNHLKGAEVRRACKNGCISCGKCEKSCPVGAISIKDNLAVIDYSKCTGCGLCHTVCPVKCIHQGNFICGSHFE